MKTLIFLTTLIFSTPILANFIEVKDKQTVVRKHELEDRVRALEQAVQQLQIKMQHMSSGDQLKDLNMYHCTLEAPLIGSFSESMPNRQQAIDRVVQTCRRRSSNASACNSSNVRCEQKPYAN